MSFPLWTPGPALSTPPLNVLPPLDPRPCSQHSSLKCPSPLDPRPPQNRTSERVDLHLRPYDCRRSESEPSSRILPLDTDLPLVPETLPYDAALNIPPSLQSNEVRYEGTLCNKNSHPSVMTLCREALCRTRLGTPPPQTSTPSPVSLPQTR